MVRNSRIDPFIDVERPLVALGNEYKDGHRVEPHQHRRAQLLYGYSGVVLATTPNGTLVMPPERGMWIPPGITHSVRMLGDVSMRSIYIEPQAIDTIPDHCQVVEISPLLRALIAEAVDIPVEYDRTDRSGALMALLLHELARLKPLPLSLPLPRSPVLVQRCQDFLLHPTAHDTIDHWARDLSMSRRAFTRMFRLETGLSFVEWRQQACLHAALPRLVAGTPVTTIALDLGYRNPAAFTSMFKRAFGYAPREIARRQALQETQRDDRR
ncbi:AraC family transcriptional regulator [Rhizobium sp. BR 314]|uniref:AraC family transcriptional regulator n=1 Tax=Rhizobium sp. BR 314 TaxID=3040013 RepID=UPI0039BFE9E1